MANPAPARGTVYELHRKPEVPGERGLPKPVAAGLRVTPRGVEGDFNRWRTEVKHGDPEYAVLVLPFEIIEDLNREGWPVRPGDLGENVTSRGIPNAAFHPSDRIDLGSAVLEVAKPCDPCDNLYLLPYVGKARGPEFLKTMIGRRGWYCRVVRPGEVRTGDPIAVGPGS